MFKPSLRLLRPQRAPFGEYLQFQARLIYVVHVGLWQFSCVGCSGFLGRSLRHDWGFCDRFSDFIFKVLSPNNVEDIWQKS